LNNVDLAEAREKMVVEQLEGRGIKNERVLAAMRSVPRDRFVPAEYADHAYDDGPLPIGSDQTISQPYIVGLMSEIAELTGNERVLEIGTGSGYQAAILAHLSAEVYSIESIPSLYERARTNLASMAAPNLHLRCSDGSDGWAEAAPFDAILVTAAMPSIARPLLGQLRADGKLVAPIGEEDLQTLVRIRRINNSWQEEYFGECRFVRMTGKLGFN
jgi:protein-L-isoaspartate(D-aspartate) O-methyltransferase